MAARPTLYVRKPGHVALKGVRPHYLSAHLVVPGPRCCSPYFSEPHCGLYQCRSVGCVKTTAGWVCIPHLRAWVYRGWVSEVGAAGALAWLAYDEARRLAAHAACLRRHRCSPYEPRPVLRGT